MSDARSEILGAIKSAIKQAGAREKADTTAVVSASQRLREPRANPIPARGRLGAKAQVDLFIREAEQASATVARVSSLSGVPREVARFLAKNNLPMTLKVAPGIAEPAIPWTRETLLSVEEGRAEGTETASVSRAFAGIAETGTLVMLSGSDNPTTLNFLPPTHVVVISASEIIGDYEESWTQLREKGEAGRFMPRAVNWITGPSRTADIEQTLLMGAHGPQRLHIVIVDEETPAS